MNIENIEKLKIFLNSEEEKKVLGLFHKVILEEADVLFLYDTRTKKGSKLQVKFTPLGICLQTTDTTIVIDQKENPYLRYLEEPYKNADQSLLFSRYKDRNQQEEQFSLAIQTKEEASENTLISSIHLSEKELLFDIMDLEHGRLYFSTLYIKSKGYTERQNAKMRTILWPFYQTHTELMTVLEEKNQDLKVQATALLPHRFEDFVGASTLKIYKNS